MPQDYYLVLGITADAGQADIKAAYRRLAKKFRPGPPGPRLIPAG